MNAPPAPSDLYVALFDGPRLFAAGEEILLSLHQACAVALVYGHGPRGLSIDRFAALLWEEDDSPAVRQRIRQLFYTIRSKLDGASIVSRNTNRLWPREEVSCDFAAGGGATAPISSDQNAEVFLRNLTPSPPEIERWVTATRAGLRTRHRASLHRRLKACQSQGDLEGAIDACESLLRLDGAREDLFKSLALLQRQLAENRITDPHVSSTRSSTNIQDAPGPNQTSDTPLLGRGTLLASILEEITPWGHGLTLSALLGESGIGKTAVCNALAEAAARRGLAVAITCCAEFESHIALTPLLEVLEGLESLPVLEEVGEPWASVLRSAAPKTFGFDPHLPRISIGSVSNRLMESVRRLLQAISNSRSSLLIVDDAQWIDQTSLSALAYTARRWEGRGLSILLSLRSEDVLVRPGDPISQFVHSFIPSSSRFELTPLADDAAREVVLRAGGASLEEEEQRRIHAAAGGNPLFLVELTRAGLRQPAIHAPHSLRNVVERRLSQASSDLREVSGTLAITGPLPVNMIAEVLGVSARSCRRTLREGIDLGLLAPSESGEWGFRHSALADAVREAVPPAQATAINSEVASLLIEQERPASSGRIALHCSLAGRRDEARSYAVKAAKEAQDVGALPEAIRFIDLALENTLDGEIEVQLLAESGRLKLLQGYTSEAAPLLEIASARHRREGNRDAAIRLAIDKYTALTEGGLIPQERGVIELQELVDEAWSLDSELATIRGLEAMIRILERLDRPSRIRALLRRAGRLRLQDSEAAADRDILLALDLFYDDGRVADEATRRGLTQARRLDLPDLIRKASLRRSLVLLYLGRGGSPEGRALLQDAIDEAERGGDLRLHHTALVNAGCWFLDTGAVDEAEGYFLRARDLQPRLESPTAEIRHLGNLAVVALCRGHYEDAESLFSRAEERIDQSVPLHARHFLNAGLGLTAVLAGRLSEARHRAERIPIPDHWYFSPVLPTRLRAEIARRIGDYRGAIKILRDVSDAVANRMRPASLTLRVELVRFLKRDGQEGAAREVAKAGREIAEDLRIHTRAHLFRNLC